MIKPDPSPPAEPILIVSDGEQGDKMEKIIAPQNDTPAGQPFVQPASPKKEPAADHLTHGDVISADPNAV